MKYKKFIDKKLKKLVCLGLFATIGLGVTASGVVTELINPEALAAHAIELPSGNVQIGQIDGVPVIKANTNDMSSQAFQDLVDGIITDSDAQYVVNKTFWGPSTQLLGGTPLANMGTGQSYWLRADGFTNADYYVSLKKNGQALIKNVGYATDIESDKKVNLDLGVIYHDSQTSNGTGSAENIYMAAKSQNGVITLGWLAPADDGSSETGGSSEGGGGPGGSGDGSMAAYINNVRFSLVLVNADTGQPLPSEKTLMALKLSDIDALQRATLGSTGAKGIIVSPDTKLAIDGQGMVATGLEAVNEDSKFLSPLSYITLRQFNAANTQYTYTQNQIDVHCDIVVGAFGEYPFEINLGGFLEIDKSTLQFGKDNWNGNYSFDPLYFEVVDKDNKVVDTIEITADGKGKSDRLRPGTYTVREKSSDWSSTGQLVIANQTVEIKSGDTTTIKPKNTAVVGQNTLQKVDTDTEKEQNGKADLTTAKYQLLYNDTSTGSAAHKAGDPVKWTDKPAPKLLVGEKVTSALIGGQTVDFGDKVVIDVDDESLQAAVGNLALGKYKWIEVDAGEGYVVDPTEHTFEIKYKDEKTENVIAEGKTSLERAIDAAIKINKMFTLPDNQGGSGFNDIEFTATPREGTIADPVKLITGVDPVSGDDGYALGNLVYGDWVLEETNAPEDREAIRPIYIHMETDLEKDILTISASYNEDDSKPFSTRKFALLDSAESNPNNQGTVGNISSEKPTISLSTLHFNNNPKAPEEPAIDVEKSNVAVPDAGLGNGQDEPNNVDNDYDDPENPFIVDPEKESPIFFRITNKGTEDLTNIKPIDTTIEGTVSIKDITWEFELNEDGYVLDKEGKLLVLKPGESFTGSGVLPKLPEGELHGNEITVSAVGTTSKTEVEDDDPWYGIVTEEPKEPGIDVEKSNIDYPDSGLGNGQDEPNNVDNDHDDKEKPFVIDPEKETEIFFRIKNSGNEDLTNIRPIDKTVEGTVSIKDITWEFDLNEDGYVLDKEGKLLVLKPGESFTGKGILPKLPENELHGNSITVEAQGVMSKKEVKDEDPWYGIVNPEKPAASEEPSKPSGIQQLYPNTGEKQVAYLVAIGIVMVCIVVVAKRDQLVLAIRSAKRRLKK
jgi:hypothetical protein